MWKFLLAAAIAVAALDFTLGCDGNFEPLRTCMKASLPNATYVAEQVKDCYTKSGCGDFSNEPPAKKTLLSVLQSLVETFVNVNSDKVQQCRSYFEPIVRSTIEPCVCKVYPDFKFPNFTYGQINSSFFGGDVNISLANCSSKAQPAFAKCINTTVGNPLQLVCQAEQTCSKTTNPNQCTVNDVQASVSKCAASELPKQKEKLNDAMKKCCGKSALLQRFTDAVDITDLLIKLIQKMGNYCTDPKQQPALQPAQNSSQSQSQSQSTLQKLQAALQQPYQEVKQQVQEVQASPKIQQGTEQVKQTSLQSLKTGFMSIVDKIKSS